MDQRSSQRKRTILDGRIVFNKRSSVINCMVRDLSDTGARIAFGHVLDIPSEFEIEIPKKGMAVWARVMWSNGREHGIMFIGSPQGAASSEAPEALEEAQLQDAGAPEPSAGDAAGIQDILDEARSRIAQVMGVPVHTIRLKLETDAPQAGAETDGG